MLGGIGLGHELVPQIGFKFYRENGFFWRG
jgi:hypothetical protein